MTMPSYYPQGILPQSTIVPKNDDLFVPYLTRLYEQIAQTVNAKDGIYFTIPITSNATNIPNLPNFGAFIVCVSYTAPDMNSAGIVTGYGPSGTWSLCKSSATASGTSGIASLSSQDGTGTWATYSLTITSTATNFQIAHNNTGVSGNFNIRILGTQGSI